MDIKRIFTENRIVIYSFLISAISLFIGIISWLENPTSSINQKIIILVLVVILVLISYFHFQIINSCKKPKSKYSRFENLLKSKITYGFIDYEPFFKMEGDIGKGIGGTILINKVFDGNLYKGELDYLKKANMNEPIYQNWHTIFDKLSNKKLFDIIATPMYETRSRLYDYNISFCIPLFYSTIGLYVNKSSIEDGNLSKDLSFEIAKDKISVKIDENGWKPEFMEGEISHIMVKKHFKKYKIKNIQKNNIERKSDENRFFNKLKNVFSDHKSCGDFIFMEVFKAEHLINKFDLDVVNILKENALIYPVSFVVRKEDTVLRNFINLRIAELKENGELLNIIESESLKYIKTDQVDDKFIQTYDFNLIEKGYKQNKVLFSQIIKKEYDILDKVYGNYIVFQNDNIIDVVSSFPKQNGNKIEILEIGCGTGITTEILFKAVDDVRVKAIDFDSKMLELADKRLKEYINNDKLELIESDALNYLRNGNDNANNDKNKFDIIISAFTIHNFDNAYRRKLLNAIKGKMKRDSLFINVDKYAPDDDIKRIKALSYRLDKYKTELEDKPVVLNEWVKHYIEDQAENKVMKVEETKKLMKSLGFEIVDYIESGEFEMMAILTAKKA